MIDYYFPPLAGAAAQRTLGYVRHLPDLGWTPIVLTVQSGEHSFNDPSLLARIPAGLVVRRARSLDPTRFVKRLLARASPDRNSLGGYTEGPVWGAARRLARLESWLFFPDRRVGWLPFAVAEAVRIRRSHPIALLYSTSTAVTSHLIAYSLRRLWGLPWVADFQDPWAEDYVSRFPSPMHRRVAHRLERLIVERANSVIVTTNPVRDAFRRRYPAHEDKLAVIPMGFDPQAFADVRAAPGAKFIITHFGTFYGSRSPGPFLTALGECLKGDGRLAQDLEVLFLGTFDPPMRALTDGLIQTYKLERIVRLSEPVPYTNGLERLLSSSVLLLVTDAGPWGRNLVPSKLFEYLAAGRPVLALAPRGAAAEYVCAAKAGIVVEPDDIPAIQRAITTLYEEWRRGELTHLPDQEIVRTFRWRELAGTLAAVFESAHAARRSHSACLGVPNH